MQLPEMRTYLREYFIEQVERRIDQYDDLLQMMVHDRDHGDVRLLKQGGRLVVFLPQSDEQSLHGDVLPSPAQLDQAGLECEFMREQPLNEKLSRWLVCYKCTR